MKSTLSEIVNDINQSKKTGLLTLAIAGDDSNLFKIFFKEGEIYHITCGKQKDTECLIQSDALEFSSCSFLPNAKMDVTHSSGLPTTAEIVRALEKKSSLLEVMTGGKSPQAAGSAEFTRVRNDLQVALVKQIGPAGAKVLAKVIDVKWRVPAPTKADLKKLVDMLKDEIEEGANRQQFIKDAEKIIA